MKFISKRVKSYLAVFLSLVLLCGTIPLSSLFVGAETINLIQNGDFESGNTSGWNTSSTSVITAVATSDAGGTGNYAAKVEYKTDWDFVYPEISVTPNTDYKLTFRVKSSDGNNGTVNILDPSWVKVGSQGFDWQADWTEHTFTFNSGDNNKFLLLFQSDCEVSANHIIYLDDVSVVKVAAEVEDNGNLLQNGDFESGEAAPWAYTWGGSYDIVEGGKDSSYAMKWDSSKGSWYSNEQTITLEANTDYVLTFDAKYNSDVTGSYAALLKTIDSDTNIKDKYFNFTSEWAAYTWEFNSGSNTDVRLLLMVAENDEASSVLIDNIVLKKVEKVTASDDGYIKDGDFETGTLDHWLNESNLTASITDDVHGGTSAMEFTGNEWSSMVQYVTVEANTDYIVTFWAKRTAGTGAYHLFIKDGDTMLGNTAINGTAADGWKQYTVNFNSGDHTSASLRFTVEDTGSKFIIDDVKMKKVTASDDGYIKDGDFETGTLDHWLNEWNLTASITDDAHDSDSAMTFTGNEWNSMVQNVTVEANTDYIVTFWAKRTAGSGAYHLFIKNGDTMLGNTAINGAAADGWKQYTVNFNSGDHTSASLRFTVEDMSSQFIIDDVKMKKKVTASDDGYIKDGDFETGTLDHWLNEWDLTASITDDAHDSDSAMTFTGNEWNSMVQNVTVEANTDYTVTFWAKRTAGTGAYHLFIKNGDAMLGSTAINGAAADGWKQYTVNFNSGAYTSASLRFAVEDMSSQFIIDDVKMVKKETQVSDDGFIKDGDFESGEFGAWTNWADDSAVKAEAARNGEYGLYLENPGSEYYGTVFQEFAVTAGKTYMVSFWGKAVGTSQSMYMKLADVTSDDTAFAHDWPKFPTDSWKQYSYSFVAAEGVEKVRLNLMPQNGSQYIDDVVVKEISNDGYIVDGDFESGTLNKWLNEWNLTASITDDAHGGNSAMTFTGKQWNSMVQNVTVEANTDYTVTFWAKRTAGSGAYHLYIKNGDTMLGNTAINGAAADGWKQYTVNFNSGDATSASLRFTVDDTSSQFIIDDVKMVKKSGDSGDSGDSGEQDPIDPNDPDVIVYETFDDIEPGELGNWIPASGVEAEVTAGAGTDRSNGIVINGAKWSRVYLEFEVEKNTAYEISFDYRESTVTAPMTVLVRPDGTTTNFFEQGSLGSTNGLWKTYKGTFNSNNNTVLRLMLHPDEKVTNSDKTVDNIIIRKIEVTDTSTGFKNGDFELGSMEHWSVQTGCNAEIVTDDPHGGQYAVKISGEQWNGFEQVVNVTPNTMYRVTFWAKRVSGSGEHSLYIMPFGVAKNLAHLPIKSSTSDGWKKYTISFSSEEYSQLAVKIGVEDPNSVFLIDDVTFGLENELTYDGFLYNGGFETGTTEKWEGANFNVITDAHDGSYALQLKGNLWDSIMQRVTLEANTEYSISLWAKKLEGNGSFCLLFKDKNGTQNLKDYFGKATGEWEKYTWTFNSEDNTEGQILLMVNNAGSSVVLDEVVMVKGKPVNKNGLLMNGDFESGDLSQWDDVYSESEVVSSDTHDGDYALHLKGSNQWSAVRQTIYTAKNTDYVLTFYVKRVAGSSNMSVWMKNGDENLKDPDGKGLGFDYAVTEEDDWLKIERRFNSHDNTTIDLLFGIAEAGNEVLLDDISVVKYEAPVIPPLTLYSFGVEANRPNSAEANLIVNGSFESDENAQWNTHTFINDVLTVVEDENARVGNKVLFFNGSNVTEPAWHVFWIDVEPQTNYIFSGWVKGPYISEDNAAKATFGVVDPDSGEFLIYKPYEYKHSKTTLQLVPTAWDDAWHLRSVAFNSGDKTKVGIAVYGAGSQLYLDDIALYKAENGVAYRNPLNTDSISVNINVEHTGCAEEDNLLDNFNLSDGGNFWQTGLGWDNGFVSVYQSEYEYGNSLQYAESDNPVGVHYIKWIDVTPNTDYVFSMNLLVQESGDGYLALLDDKIGTPVPFVQADFDQDVYGEEWADFAIKFNTGVYSRIGIAIVDKGGQALVDNLRIFEVADGADVEDPFIEAPEGDGSGDGGDKNPATGGSLAGLLLAGALLPASAVALMVSKKKRK